VGWVLSGRAASEYRNYPFNGFVEFPRGSKHYYGTSDDGLYLLEGPTDDGCPIDAHIKTHLMDYGTGVYKRGPDIYVGMTSGKHVLLKVTTIHPRTGERRTDIYTQTVVPGSNLKSNHLRVGMGLKSRYWQWELANVDGGDFEIDEIAWMPLQLDRRI
jgi:hypothetical protein